MAMNAAMKERLAKAKAVGPNMNEATAGGGDYTPPAEGPARLRLVSYIELGTHVEQHGQFKGKKNKKVQLVFELSGKNYPPREADGKKFPILMKMEMTYSLSERSHFFKLFKEMNAAYGGQYTIMAEMLGHAFLGTVEHTHKGEGANKRTYANLKNVRKAVRLDEEENEVPIAVDEALTPETMFVWEIATIEDWDALFIDGTYPERKDKDGNVIAKEASKNIIQNKIRQAVDFDSLPCYQLIKAGASAADEASMDESLGGDDNPPFAEDPADEGAPVTKPQGEADIGDLV